MYRPTTDPRGSGTSGGAADAAAARDPLAASATSAAHASHPARCVSTAASAGACRRPSTSAMTVSDSRQPNRVSSCAAGATG